MHFTVEVDQEEDGRFIAEVTELPGTLACGETRVEAVAKVEAQAFRLLADRLEHGEPAPQVSQFFAVAA